MVTAIVVFNDSQGIGRSLSQAWKQNGKEDGSLFTAQEETTLLISAASLGKSTEELSSGAASVVKILAEKNCKEAFLLGVTASTPQNEAGHSFAGVFLRLCRIYGVVVHAILREAAAPKRCSSAQDVQAAVAHAIQKIPAEHSQRFDIARPDYSGVAAGIKSDSITQLHELYL